MRKANLKNRFRVVITLEDGAQALFVDTGKAVGNAQGRG
jgi:hypothetical protein